MIEVWANRRNSPMAAELVAQLASEGHLAREANVEYFDPDQQDTGVDRAYHDGTDPRVPAFYADHGVPCELMPGIGGDARHTADSLARAVQGPGETSGQHYIEKSGTWYKLIGPDGEQIGKSQRSEDDAWALLEDD